jgi:hypothetical protein
VIPVHFTRLLRAAARYKAGLWWGIACVAASNVVMLSQPQVLRHAIDDLYRGVTAEKLGRYALFVMGIAVLAGLFRFGMRHWVIGISRRLEFDLRNELFAHLQRLPVEWFQGRRTGELMSIATNDMAAVRMMLGPGVMYTVNTVTVMVLSVTFMLGISPRLTLLSLLPLPLVSLSVWWFGDRIHRRFERVQERMGQLSAQVQENLAGLRVVRAFGAERRESERFDELSEGYRLGHLELIRISGVFQPSLAFWSGVGRPARDLGGRSRGRGEPHHARPVRGVHRVPGDAQLADGGAGLGDQHLPARLSLVPAHRRAARAGAVHRQRRRMPCARRVPRAASWSSRTSRSPTPAVPNRCLHDVSFHVPAGSDGGARGPHGLGQEHRCSRCCRACSIRRRARCSWTGTTCARWTWRGCARRWRACRRTRSCSRPRSRRTSPTAWTARTAPPWSVPPRWRISTARSHRSPTATPRSWASAASRSRAGRSSAPPSPAPSYATRRSCCSTTASPTWTRRPRRPSSKGCAVRCAAAPRCWSRTA